MSDYGVIRTEWMYHITCDPILQGNIDRILTLHDGANEPQGASPRFVKNRNEFSV
jgi:hypothetical protein